MWAALGDVAHYVEPFGGSLAILLQRPHQANRAYFSETVNDADGLLVNAWRSIQFHPQETAEAASWPVSEVDLMARHLAILRWADDAMRERLRADPAFCNPAVGGWWLWGQSSWIGSGWCSGRGPWTVDLDTGRVVRRPPGQAKSMLPHLTGNGQGVNHAQLREPGVASKLPNFGDDGRGVNRPQLREPGVNNALPHLGNNGQGVNHAGLREPGVMGLCDPDPEWHPMTMPELRNWFAFLSARLRHVRILCGDWTRLVTGGATKTLPVRQGGVCGVFLDPPYDASVRDDRIYSIDDGRVAERVRAWCLDHGQDPQYRIVLAGYDSEHGELEDQGWRVIEWFRAGFLKGGMGNLGGTGNHQQHRERLWLSPHCLDDRDAGDEAWLW